jgi:hypothetical protein
MRSIVIGAHLKAPPIVDFTASLPTPQEGYPWLHYSSEQQLYGVVVRSVDHTNGAHQGAQKRTPCQVYGGQIQFMPNFADGSPPALLRQGCPPAYHFVRE